MHSTLVESLLAAAKTDKGIIFVTSEKDEDTLLYSDLLNEAKSIYIRLNEMNVQKGDEVVFQFWSLKNFICTYWACLLGGYIPVPLALGKQSDSALKLFNVWQQLNNPWLVSDESKTLSLLATHAEENKAGIQIAELWQSNVSKRYLTLDPQVIQKNIHVDLPLVSANDIAFIQFSSGSTGAPKGVALTHANLLTNINDLLGAVECNCDDVFLSWKPISHDFGMIAFHIAPVVAAVTQVRIPMETYLWSPVIWFQMVHKYRATILGSPNFGYRHFLKFYKRRNSNELDWDLSCVKTIINGAESISASLCHEFLNEMVQYGLRPESMRPGYGLAEASLVVSLSKLGDGVREISVHREKMSIGEQVELLDPGHENAVKLVDCGPAFPATELRITSAEREPLKDGVVGQIEIRGGNVTSAYYNNASATAKAINKDGWVNTEDLGFIHNGRLVFANRIKEMIILGGVNYFPHDIEKSILRIKGDDALNQYVACSIPCDSGEGEQLAIFVYYKKNLSDFNRVSAEICDIVSDSFGVKVDVVLPTRNIPKTTSGKVQRYVLRNQYLEGEFDSTLVSLGKPPRLQIEKSERGTLVTVNTIKDQLAALVAEECKLPSVSHSESFFNLGVSSLRLLTLRDTIESSFGVELDVSQILDNPNINAIATLIDTANAPCVSKDKGVEAIGTDTGVAGPSEDAIAIVGMACRFPGNVQTPEEFWSLLSESVDPITEMPSTRWPPVERDGLVTRQVGSLEGIDLFDPYFFGITPSEAESMDPQQRLLLEVCHQALENSGIRVPEIKGSKTGVFLGISGTEYAGVGRALGHATSTYTYTGTMFNTAAGRIAYTFGLQGPCVSLDTACSSSLTAVHLGANELKAKSCDRVIAAAVGLMLTPDGHVCFSQMNALSPSGRSRSFDDGADGYIRSEGCAAVVLKRLSDAEQDGDTVLAVIRGSAINHNGQSGGLTVPSGQSQEMLIKAALQNARVDAKSIDYVEAHGSGTKLGDPQEVSALNRVFNDRERPLYIGSVKSNLGHLEAVAGLAGLQKVVLSLQHGAIPANLHFKRPNTLINWDKSTLKVVDKLTPFNPEQPFRYAGISSLGINGSNAHLVLEAPKKQSKLANVKNRQLSSNDFLITLSAPSEASLRATLENFYNADLSGYSIESLSRATQFQRSHYAVRYATLVSDIPALKTKLGRRLDKQQQASLSKLYKDVSQPRTVFMFTGQGSHYVNMARELYLEFDFFKVLLDQCSDLFSEELGVSLTNVLYGEANEGLNDVAISQALIFSVEYSLAKLWQQLGVEPDVVLGHSIGEYAAACFCEVMSLCDAVSMVLARGRVMKSAPAGAMLGVLSDEASVTSMIDDTADLHIAAINAPSNVTVSGSAEAMAAFSLKLKKARIFTEPLAIKQPYHSPLMVPVVEELRAALASVSTKRPNKIFISTQLGEVVTASTPLDSEYWCQHLCQPVKFMQALNQVTLDEQATCFIEIGGTATLSGLASQVTDKPQFKFLPSLREGRSAWVQFNESLAQAYMAGTEISWTTFHNCKETVLHGLPNTGFGRERYWFAETGKKVPASACALSVTRQPALEKATNSATLPEVVDEVYILVELVSTISQVTGVTEDQLQHDTNLFSLGVDSLMLVQLDKRIQSRFHVEISLAQFFSELHTPEKLSRYIDNNLSEESRRSLKTLQQSDVEINATELYVPNLDESGNSVLLHSMEKQLQIIQQQLASLGALSPATGIAQSANNVQTKPVQARQYTRDIVMVADELSAQQKAFVSALTEKLNAATPKSKKYAEEHRSAFADWIATLNFTLTTKEFTYPLVAERSSGSRFWDVDGNEYIDTAMGYGVCLFGHNPPFVTEAIQNQLALGMELGPQNKLAGQVASLVSELTGVERVAFANTGSEAVMVAIRLARAVTKRDKIVRFVTSFHGSFDGILAEMGEGGSEPMAAGIASSMVQDTLVMQYGAEASLESIAHQAGSIAAVLVEPVQSRNPSLQPQAYLKQLRELTALHGIALIFDEMITGFRVHPGGAQAHFDVKADIVTYGKIVGGGLPIGVLGGKKCYMDAIDGGEWRFGDSSGPNKETTFFAGTFCKHPLTMAAALAVLTKIRKDGPALQQSLNHITERFSDRLNSLFASKQVPITVKHFSSMYRLESGAAQDMPRHSLEMNLFFKLLQLQGIYVWERRTCFISTVHSVEDLDAIYDAVDAAVDKLRAGGFSFRRANIDLIERNRLLSVSSEESRMYVLTQMQGGDQAYRISGALRITGKLDVEHLQDSFKVLCQRHPILMSNYRIDNGQIFRFEKECTDIPVVTHLSYDEKYLDGNADLFDLSEGPLWQAKIIKRAQEEHILVLELHHIIADGTSISILIEELFQIYSNQKLKPLTPPYNKFVEQEGKYLISDTFKSNIEYWQQQFNTTPEPLQLPSDRARGAINDFAGANLHFTLDSSVTRSVHAAAKAMHTTPFITLLASWFAWLHTTSQQSDLCVGIPFDRRGSVFDRTVGMFSQTLAIRNNILPEQSFESLVTKISTLCTHAFEHSDVPLDKIIDAIEIQRDLSRNPLFDTMFIYESGNRRYQNVDSLSFEPVQLNNHASAFDLTVELTEQAGEIQGQMIYASRLFDSSRIEQWCSSFVEFLKKAVEQTAKPIFQLGELSDKNVSQLNSFHGKNIPVPEKTVIDAFVDIARSIPACEALRAKDRTLTYEELHNEVDQLAKRLIEQGVKPGDAVAVLLVRDSYLIVAILAVLRCGACYIPLDPKYPSQRVQYMIDHAQVSLLIARAITVEELTFSGKIIDPTAEFNAAPVTDITFPEIPLDYLAYIIYTSGSTGNPKGVMLQHLNLSHFIAGITDAITFPEDTITLGLTTVSFDIFVLEVFVTLTRMGGCLVLADEHEQQDPEACTKRIIQEKINVVQITPSRLQVLLANHKAADIFSGVKVLIVGGESFPAEHLTALQAVKHLQVFNVYGPTEATVWATCAELTTRSDISIGKPLANVNAYVLGANLQRLPVGQKGELYLAGNFLAKGYVFDKDKTDEAFIKNPFVEGTRMYRTGDLASWSSNGELVHHGRRDHQVKLRGYRIELPEVEKALSDLNDVKQAAVVVRELSDGNPVLVAFCTTSSECNEADFSKLVRSNLKRVLPEFMLPSIVCLLEALPQTPNGKIDRNRLPQSTNLIEPEGVGSVTEVFENKLEIEILKIWQTLLGERPISRHDSFFDVGGSSFSLLLLQTELNKLKPGLVQVPDLFSHPNIKSQRELIESRMQSQLAANYQPLDVPQGFWDAATNESKQGSLVVEYDAELSEVLRQTSQSKSVHAYDLLIGLFAVYFNKRLGMHTVSLYMAAGDSNGYQHIEVDFSIANNLDDVFLIVHQAAKSSARISVPPKDEQRLGALILFKSKDQVLNSRHRRFDLQVSLNVDSANIAEPLLQIDFDPARVNQSIVRGWVSDYLRLAKALLSPSHKRISA